MRIKKSISILILMFAVIATGCDDGKVNDTQDVNNTPEANRLEFTNETVIAKEKTEGLNMVFGNNNAENTKVATREYFENLDKESKLEDIVAEVGNYGIKGSGILYHVWKLDDGTEADLVFDSKGRITMIYIIDGENSERIYKREY